MTKLSTVPAEVTLPSWTDGASITAFITAGVASAISLITLIHPGFTEPSWIANDVPLIGPAIAAVVVTINSITHRSAQKAAIVASLNATAQAPGTVGSVVVNQAK